MGLPELKHVSFYFFIFILHLSLRSFRAHPMTISGLIYVMLDCGIVECVSIDEVDIMCHGLDLLLNAILLLSFIELCLVCFQISFTMTLLDFCWLIRKLPSYVHLALCWGDWHCD